MKLPFDKETFLATFNGQEAVIGKNCLPSAQIDTAARVKFSDGKFEGDMSGLWTVESGQVILTDIWNKPVFRFYGLETKNNSVYMVGEPFMEAHLSGFARAILYKYELLTQWYNICISSHVDYPEALTRLLRSLVRAKVPKQKVVIAVGGAKEFKAEDVDGWKYIYTTENLDGFTALLNLPTDLDTWWLLLHDTCEVMDDFNEKTQKVDAGLKYDMVLPALPCEIGFYSSEFVKRIYSQGYLKNPVSLDALKKYSAIFNNLGRAEGARHIATKDVYGTGTQRDVLYIDSIGVKKYRRTKGMAAKP